MLSVPETMPALENMKKLWVHEVLRVFGDRLVEQTDIDWLVQQIRDTLREKMDVDMDTLFAEFKSANSTRVSAKNVTC